MAAGIGIGLVAAVLIVDAGLPCAGQELPDQRDAGGLAAAVDFRPPGVHAGPAAVGLGRGNVSRCQKAEVENRMTSFCLNSAF